jgi:hypothetical protein
MEFVLFVCFAWILLVSVKNTQGEEEPFAVLPV